MRYVESSEFKKAAKKRGPRNLAVRFASTSPLLEADARTFTFCFSDSGVDLAGDRLNASGWDTENYSKNPIVIWSHMAERPIGRSSNLRVKGNALYGDITFAETPLAEEIFQLVSKGFLKAVSVGFLPLKYSFSDDEDRPGGIDYQSMKLLEVSVCSIPCNPRALIEARSAGLKTDEFDAWMVERIADKTTREPDRAVFKTLLNTHDMTCREAGMSESDPASGGFTTGNCGRDKDEDCGMTDPEECEVHRAENDEVEVHLMALTNALKHAREEIKKWDAHVAKSARIARKSEDDSEEDGEEGREDPEVLHSKMMAHHKAADELQDAADDHREECIKCHKALIKCYKDMDSDDEETESEGDDEDDDRHDDDDEIKALRARARAKALAARAA